MNPSLEMMLERYREHHRHPVNRAMHAAGIPTLAMALPLLFIAPRAGVALGAAGLGLQLLGHAVEGNAPLFVGDPRFVLVGAAWFTEELRARLAGRRP